MLDFVGKTSPDRLRQSIYTYQNPTFGTGIAFNADPTAIAATEAAIIIDNSGTVDGGDNEFVIPTKIQLICTVDGAGASSASLLFKLDNKNRYASGGTELTGIQNWVDTDAAFFRETPKGKVYAGDITAAAEGTAVQVGRCKLKTGADPCFIVGDVFTIHFGEPGVASGGVDAGTAVTINRDISVDPVWIGRNSSLVIHPLYPAQTGAPSFEIIVTTIEWNPKRGF